jgi:hypothetical protein
MIVTTSPAVRGRSVQDHRQYAFARSSRDLLRLISGLILLVLGLVLAMVFSDALVASRPT